MANEQEQKSGAVDLSVNTAVNSTNSVIGIRNGFSGEFHSDGLLRIDGDFCGTIKGRGVVLIGESGRIIGDVYAASIRLGGKVKGNIYALEKIDILSTGKLIGDFASLRFHVEEGVVFNGKGKTMSKDNLEKLFKEAVDTATPIIKEDF